jgi:hypothetical protein
MKFENWRILGFFIIVFWISENHSLAQCGSTPTFLGNDTAICANQSLNLSGPSNFLNYGWNNTATSKNIAITNPGTYWCKATKMGTTNLVSNGDFSSGNTGFTTGHTYGT